MGGSYLVTASICVLQVPRDGDNSEVILKNAYSVIRSAKKIKNTYEVFTRELLDVSFNKINVVNLLRDSINRDLFTLFYQPIVDSNEKLVYAEALLRCVNTDAGLPVGGPGMLFPLIEEAGLAKEVDNMVIRKAFHDMEMHIKKSFNISINLSTNQLINPGYGEFLSSFASQHGIENRQIILEVTENRLMKNLSAGRECLRMLQTRGFTIAIDDFGTGFSSLAYLAELPVDIIKIDMVFVQSVPGDAKKEAMARHIVGLAHSLNLKVIAEGFETREQFDFFREMGCDLFQGYLFSLPVPLRELIAEYIKN
jgi:polar amino acid transport system substrate-binding protein